MDTKTIFLKRLEEMIAVRKTNPKRLSIDAGLNARAVTDIFDRASAPRIDNAKKLANALQTTAAYLIGETDDPTVPTPPARTSAPSLPMWVARVGAKATWDDEGRPALALILEDDAGAEHRFVLPEGVARIGHDRQENALRRLSEDADRKAGETSI